MTADLLSQFLVGSTFLGVQKSPSGWEVTFSKQFLEQPGNLAKTKKYITKLCNQFKHLGTFEIPTNVCFRYCHPEKDLVIVGKITEDKMAFLQIFTGQQVYNKFLNGFCDFYTDFQFSSPNPWSSNKFIFVAEKKSDGNEYKDTFGEKFEDKGDPVLGIYDLAVDQIDFIELDYYPMSPSFINESTILFQIYSKSEVKLGILYCLNRPTQIALLGIHSKKLTVLSDSALSARSPRFITDSVFYLQAPIYASHYSAAKVMAYDPKSQKTTIIVEDHFEEALKPHSSDAVAFILNPSVKLTQPIKTTQKTVLNEDGELLAVVGVYCFFKETSIKAFPSLHAVNIKDGRKICILKEASIREMDLIEKQIITMSPTFDILWYKRKGNESLIMIPHGGPNCSISDVFSVELNYFIASGYDVALINYTGSAGYSQEAIDKLVIGKHDIEDTLQAALKLKSLYKHLFAYGGSHGGFIISTMLGKYSDLFAAASLVNPVIDYMSMVAISDIPDWCFGQFKLPFDLHNVYKPEMSALLSQVSSGCYAKDVKSPVLLLLGGRDLRVPMAQGLFWRKLCHHINSGKFTLKLYDDSDHSLDSEKSFFDVPIQVISFFNLVLQE